MAKQSTRKKSGKKFPPEQVDEIKQSIQRAVEYVDNWKRNQLINLALAPSKNLPIFVPVRKDAYLIGHFGLKRDNGLWEVCNTYTDETKIFNYRTSAIVYSICSQTGRVKLAQEIAKHDDKILRCKERVELFRLRKESAKKRQDYWRFDYFYIMCNSAEFELEEAKIQLEKTLNLAKYFKIWE